MALNIDGIINALESHAMAIGYFERVGLHEPKNAPQTGLTCAIWMNEIRTTQSSGLDQSSAVLMFNVRLYTSMIQEPQDLIDTQMTQAIDALFSAYIGNFQLGLPAQVRALDALGMDGPLLTGKAGYLTQDGLLYRVFTITLPLIVNDVWSEVA